MFSKGESQVCVCVCVSMAKVKDLYSVKFKRNKMNWENLLEEPGNGECMCILIGISAIKWHSL